MEPFFNKTKPSEFLQAMVDGLRRVQEDPVKRVSMDTFGSWDSESPICYGCAATWALDELLPQRLTAYGVSQLTHALIHYSSDDEFERGETPQYVREVLADETVDNVTVGRVCEFEFAIDGARRGQLNNLAIFCDLPEHHLLPWQELWSMDTDNYVEQLPKVEQAIAEMRYENL